MRQKIGIILGNITKIKVDAIVNAANSSLMGGGGVDGAIHRAGGSEIEEDCRKIIALQGSCKTGEAVITRAGKLPARFVIHTVGPVWQDGNNNEKIKLAECYTKSLQLAINNKCKTIAFPNISTGIYGFPKKEAAHISVKAVKDFVLNSHELDKVILVCFDPESFNYLETELSK